MRRMRGRGLWIILGGRAMLGWWCRCCKSCYLIRLGRSPFGRCSSSLDDPVPDVDETEELQLRDSISKVTF